MYRIKILSTGKYSNVTLGYRYCLTKKSAKNMINTFSKAESDFTIEKLVRIHADIFCWTNDDEKDSVFDYYFGRMNEEV